jgi:hypothetical protein
MIQLRDLMLVSFVCFVYVGVVGSCSVLFVYVGVVCVSPISVCPYVYQRFDFPLVA